MKKLFKRSITIFKKSSRQSKVLLVLFIIAVLFTRSYNLAETVRFTQDESSDLARMHQYYINKQISLVGPISNDRSKVFSSLSYYMIMPFAIAGDFTPVSPVYGMAFLGVLTAIFMLLLARSVNKKLVIPVAILITIWYPLVLMSRWAWNPNFILFWASLALLVYQYRKMIGWFAYLFIGLAFGAMFHHHYLALFTTAPFLLFISLPLLKKKQYKPVILMAVGYILPHLTFALFDLKNPPGLFFGRYLSGGKTPHVSQELTLALAWEHLIRNIKIYPSAFVKNVYLQAAFMLAFVSLAIFELKSHTYRTITWFIPAVAVIFAGVVLGDFQTRYVYSSIAFAFVFILFPRKEKITNYLSQGIIAVLILGSVLSIKQQLTIPTVVPGGRVFHDASLIIIDILHSNDINNANVAAIGSKDKAVLAERYRDYIRMRGGDLRGETEYGVSEHLFVVTTATNERLREDKSYAMIAFEDKVFRGVFDIENSDWKVFWYGTE